MRQKPGYPNLSVKLYEDVQAWQDNRFIELAATITTLTLRDSLFGRNEGMLQFSDSGNMHTRMDGEHLVTISVATANTSNIHNRLYSTKYNGVSVDNKGDNIISIQLSAYHHTQDLKFSRAFFTNAGDSISEMIRVLYRDAEQLTPTINAINVFVPKVPWIGTIETYYQYIREVGISVDNESFVFVYEDFNGINITDWKTISESAEKVIAVGDPQVIGDFVDDLGMPLAYDFIWESKSNQFIRKPNENVTYYSYSPNTRKIERITVGDGSNSVMINRGGMYGDMTYANGYEEAIRLQTISQYDSYASCKMLGDFDIFPGSKLSFKDNKDQFKTSFYVDEVIHEITQNDSRTTLYVFTHSKDLRPVDLVKVKPIEIPAMTESIDGTYYEDNSDKAKDGYQWDLNRLSASAIRRAAGRTTGMGRCALYVRQALEDAQIGKMFSGGLGNANEMGPRLTSMGWAVVGNNVVNPVKGDIAIFMRTNTPLGTKHGHVCIFTGNKWVSDFIQSSVQPNLKSKLPYTVYRAKNGLL